MGFKMYPYQEAAAQWIMDHRAAGLFLEMGLGKTVITLTAVKKLIEQGEVRRVLVIAPLRVAATVWAEEIDKWDHLHGLKAVKALGDRQERLEAVKAGAEITIINRENVEWLVDVLSVKKKWPFDMVVIDELSSFKSSHSKRFRALRRARPAMKRIVGLTGTPAPNGLIDLWSQVFLLDQGAHLGRTLGAYRDAYFNPGRRNQQIVFEWLPKPGAERQIYGKLQDFCMSMRAADYLQMPDRLVRTVKVDMIPAARKAYDTMAHDLVLPLQGKEITAENAAVVVGKLLQMANGAVYDEARGVHVIHEAKLDALQDLVEAANGNPVLVFYAYQHDAARIQERFPEARLLITADDVNSWNAGQVPLMLAHPDSAGHGLNLQEGGHILVWFGLTWSLEKYQQACARLHRQGQKRPVTIYHIIASGTVDEAVLQVLEGKKKLQDALIDAVKLEVEKHGC